MASGERVHRTSHKWEIGAPAGVVHGLIADAERWPLFLPCGVHVEVLDFDGNEERLRMWATAPGTSRCWTARRFLDAARRRVDFRYEGQSGPVRAIDGVWQVEERGPAACRLVLRHAFTVTGAAPGDGAETVRAVDSGIRAALERLRSSAERWTELDGLVLAFEDEIRVKGPAELVYDFLYRVGEWPGVVPHVARVELTEDAPGVQRLTTDTRGADGTLRTTEAMRVCFPHAGRIVHKETDTSALVAARTCDWQLVPDTRGVSVVCRQAVVVRDEAVEQILGSGAGLAEARRHLREELGREALAVLEPARDHAERAVRTIHMS
ncbi:SRPBCC family protein [Streptomyces sp. NPDC057137]|uniref:aromatase/cyclase n=1 Tax=Streptomyces sp. NPDC057137 TaxID=3346030 RepID=UPI0036343699